MVPSPFQCRTLLAGAIFPLLLVSSGHRSAYAQTVPPHRQDTCANGIVSYQGGVNGEIRICGAILQADPKLSVELDQVRQLLSQQQAQLTRLTRSVNSVGSNLDLTRQTQLLQSLIAKLGTNQETATTRAGHLSTALEGVETQITNVRSQPEEAAVLQSKLGGSLGDAIAQLDTGEAMAELNDIRAEVHKIDETTTRTEKDVEKIRSTLDLQLHPERALPPEEGRLYTQMSPLLMEVSQFWQRWQLADQKAWRSHLNEAVANTHKGGGFRESLQQAFSPITADYQQNLLPQLNAWRSQIERRVPAAGDVPGFAPVSDEAGVLLAQGRVRTLLQQYLSGDPHPLPELVREGHELQAKLANVSSRMRDAYLTASSADLQRRAASTPPAVPRHEFQPPGSVYDESVDGPIQREFLADLEPKLRAWQKGVTKFFPDFKVTDFSGVRTSNDMQESQQGFDQEVLRVNQKVVEQVRAASNTSP